MNVKEFEDAVRIIEGIRIVIRASSNSEVGDYSYKLAAQGNWRINQLLANRIKPLVGNLEVVVQRGGDGAQPNGNVILQTLRATYGQ